VPQLVGIEMTPIYSGTPVAHDVTYTQRNEIVGLLALVRLYVLLFVVEV
jgi:hypothetical protein